MKKLAQQRNFCSGIIAADKTVVFISYSRKDTVFADLLIADLEKDGFDARIDREDIVKGEDWKKRLEDLIVEADAMVFLISPDSVASEICLREAERAEELAKRVLPVICKPTDGKLIPENIRRLNYTFLETDEKKLAEYPKLVDSLRQDADLVRQHTALAKQASNWKNGGSLLRGKISSKRKPGGKAWPISPTQATTE